MKTAKSFEKAFEWMDSVRMEDFQEKGFYQKLEGYLSDVADWSNEQQNQFVKATLASFEGCYRWTFIYAESQSNLFDLIEAGESTLKSLDLVAKTFPNVEETQRLSFILSEVERIKTHRQHPWYPRKPKEKPYASSLSIKFALGLLNSLGKPKEMQDRGLKLAVINHLMYRENKLKPKVLFDIFFEEVGFDEQFGASSEAWNYLLELDIHSYLLNKMTELHLDSRAELYTKICPPSTPYLGGGFQGQYVPISSQAVGDLAFLPNLQTIYIDDQCELKIEYYCPILNNGKYPSHPAELFRCETVVLDTAFVEALKKRGIEIKHRGQVVAI